MNAIIFPGQGTQFTGMGKTLYDNFSESRKVFDVMDEVLGFKLSEKCFYGTADELKDTALQQLAILAVSLAAYEPVKDKLKDVKYFSGLSLGEYSCLYAGGVVTLEDLTVLVRERGTAMQKAAQLTSAGMIALIGADIKEVRDASNELNFYLSNFNSPQQIVISTAKENTDKVASYFSEKGIRTISLEVSGGFHSPFMQSAKEKLANVIKTMPFSSAKVPIVSNYTAKGHIDPIEIKSNLLAQLVSPVLWNDCVEYLRSNGVSLLYEVGPGKVLKGLTRKIDRELKVVNIGDVSDINTIM